MFHVKPRRGVTLKIKSYFLWKVKKYLWMSSAAVVICALRVKTYSMHKSSALIYLPNKWRAFALQKHLTLFGKNGSVLDAKKIMSRQLTTSIVLNNWALVAEVIELYGCVCSDPLGQWITDWKRGQRTLNAVLLKLHCLKYLKEPYSYCLKVCI